MTHSFALWYALFCKFRSTKIYTVIADFSKVEAVETCLLSGIARSLLLVTVTNLKSTKQSELPVSIRKQVTMLFTFPQTTA